MANNLSSKTYSLQQTKAIMFAGLNYTIPIETIKLINYLTEQIGSSSFINNKVFHKKEQKEYLSTNNQGSGFKTDKKKRRGNKGMEIHNEDWDTLRSFQTTTIDQKTGFDASIDKLRIILSKLTKDKFQLIKEQLINGINEFLIIDTNNVNDNDNVNDNNILTDMIGNMIFDVSLNNKFLLKMYADFYSELLIMYDWLRPIVFNRLEIYLNLFDNMMYVNPDKDYDKFCDMNAENEKRKLTTQMFVNLSLNGVIPKIKIYELLVSLLRTINDFVNQIDKKFEVDEITENIAILFNKEIIDYVENDDFDKEKYMIDDLCIIDLIKMLAKSKAKDYKSLSNKAIFKYMDLIEM